MLNKIDDLKGMEIYTPSGIFVGIVNDIILDLPNMRAYGILVERINPILAEENISISIPFRWIMSIGDVIILNTFPENRIHADVTGYLSNVDIRR